MTWIRRCCKGMCSTWASWLISGNHAYATAAPLRCPRALTCIAPFSEPGKLAFLWFCYGNYGNHSINKACVRYVACITVKLLCARPEKDAQPFASSWGGTEDCNREVFQVQCSNSEKSSKSHSCILCRTKTALLIDWASGNGPRNQGSRT